MTTAIQAAIEALDTAGPHLDAAPHAQALCLAAAEGLLDEAAHRPEPYGWMTDGVRRLYAGPYAELDAREEARRAGGTCVAFAVYRAAT